MEGFLYGERGIFVELIRKMRDVTVYLKFKWRLTVSFTLTDFQQYYPNGRLPESGCMNYIKMALQNVYMSERNPQSRY